MPYRQRNRRGQGGRLRTEILAAATDLLDTGGGERAVTLRAVARRVGIAAPSIYPHFPDPGTLLRAVVRQASADLADRLRTVSHHDDPRRRLFALCSAYLDFAGEHPARYRAMFDGDPASGTEVLRILTDGLTACHTSDAPATDAFALWLGLHGLAHQRAVARSFPWPADIAERITIPLSHLTPGGPTHDHPHLGRHPHHHRR
ncbi:TetR/AcrR family transcriptional regulator [Nonomuraea sp. NPDC050404]|uniref:TetR/AcrR family transcriptional regulator n=1 Tax=Nonomuraea sp. NPDC050404 TaxID=3155783 RepID=UPI0033CF9EFB